jgi:biotin transport system substrate-specific component
MAEIVPLYPTQAAPARTPALVRYTGLTVAATALVAVAAHVSVPLFFTPVPITLQTLAVLFLGLLMGPRWSFATLSLYLAEGAAGLPVFSPHGPGGVLQLFGPTGGYLLSYPFAAAAAGLLFHWLGRRLAPLFTGGGFIAAVVSAFVPSLFILAVGAVWLAAQTHAPARLILAQAVVPFFAGDLIKVCLAAAAVTGIARLNRGKIDRQDGDRPDAATRPA